MSVIDDAKEIFAESPEGEGYIVALPNPRSPDQNLWDGDGRAPEARQRVLFLKKFKGWDADVTGGSIGNAHVYATWQEAAAAAQSWSHSNELTTRILHIRRKRPYELVEHFPITVLDALAEL